MMHDSRAVIFDMDGVLVDSFHAHYLSWLQMGQASGLTFTEAEFAATFGRTSREIIEHFWGGGRLTDAEIAALDVVKEAAYRQIVARDLPAMPGAREVLGKLHAAGFRLALGSSGPPENVALVLERLEVRPWFSAVVTGADVTRGKPDPQVFLLAAEHLGVEPSRCAVVEDAPAGIAAAHAAGMTAVGFPSTGRRPEDLAAADCLIQSLRELTPDFLHRQIGIRD
jgi:beta-phosphoglucomutase